MRKESFVRGLGKSSYLAQLLHYRQYRRKPFVMLRVARSKATTCLHQLVKLTPDSKISPANRTKPLRLTNEFAPILKTFYRRISEIVAIRFRPQTANTKILYMTRKNAPVFIFNSQTFTHTSSFDASSEFDDSHFNRMSGNTYMMRGKQAG